jgi:hypothetical protein
VGVCIQCRSVDSTATTIVNQTNYDYSMRIVARDPAGLSATGVFAASANVAPVAPVIGTQTTSQNIAYSYTLPVFTDANNNALTYSVSNLPPGMSFNIGTRTISGTPSTAGSWAVTYTANDGKGGVTSTTFAFNVQANNAPTAPTVAAQNGTLNVALSVPLPAFTDADFDTLTYSISGLPPGLTFDGGNRTIIGTPTATGTWNVTYSANDGRGGTASVTFSFTIGTSVPGNRPPQVNIALEDQGATSGYAFQYIIPANAFIDPDNNPLTYAATLYSGAQLPAWLSFNAATRTFSGMPAGTGNQTWTIRVSATDPSGLSAYDDFILSKEGSGGSKSIEEGEDPKSGFDQPLADTDTASGVDTTEKGFMDAVPIDAAIADSVDAGSRQYRFDMGTAYALDDFEISIEEKPDPDIGEILPMPKIDPVINSVPVQTQAGRRRAVRRSRRAGHVYRFGRWCSRVVRTDVRRSRPDGGPFREVWRQ